LVRGYFEIRIDTVEEKSGEQTRTSHLRLIVDNDAAPDHRE
jgi:hypothetical protein